MQVAEPQTRRWTRNEYYRMAEWGLFQDQRVELIDGEVLVMSPQKSGHYTAMLLTAETLRMAFGAGFTVRTQGPLAVSPLSEPEPDVAVVEGSPLDFARHHPATALLVVEASDSTLTFDRTKKAETA